MAPSAIPALSPHGCPSPPSGGPFVCLFVCCGRLVCSGCLRGRLYGRPLGCLSGMTACPLHIAVPPLIKLSAILPNVNLQCLLVRLIVQIRVGTVRELLRPSSSKFKRFRLQFSSVQFPILLSLWKVRSVQFNQVTVISKVQFVQFEVHSVQFFNVQTQFRWATTPPDEAAARLA